MYTQATASPKPQLWHWICRPTNLCTRKGSFMNSACYFLLNNMITIGWEFWKCRLLSSVTYEAASSTKCNRYFAQCELTRQECLLGNPYYSTL